LCPCNREWRKAEPGFAGDATHASRLLAQWMGEFCRSTLHDAEESVGSAPLHGQAESNGYCLHNANWEEQASLK
jgi:hypothetical protein